MDKADKISKSSKSHPTRGEWIEIIWSNRWNCCWQVSPHTG